MNKFLSGLFVVTALFGCGSGSQTTSNPCGDITPKIVASAVSAIPSGANSYIIQGYDMDGFSGIDLTISYDSSSLSSPSVSQGSLIEGALMAVNMNTPGIIRIAVISTKTFTGTGQIGQITFVRNGSGGITSFTAKLINSQGTETAIFGSNSSSRDSISIPATPSSQPSQQAASTSPGQITACTR